MSSQMPSGFRKRFSTMVLALSLALPLTSFMSTAPAAAWGNSFSGNQCASDRVLSRLSRKMDHKYWRYTQTDLRLVEISNPRLTFDQPGEEPHTAGRQYCRATALLSDGKSRDVWYVLEKSYGFAGTPGTTNLEFCIAELDRWNVYGRKCASLKDYRNK